MSVLSGTSVLHEFFRFIEARARDYSHPSRLGGERDLQHELNSFISLALAAYEELGDLSREATVLTPPESGSDAVIAGIREAHARYLEACEPLLRLIERARLLSIVPKRLEPFMATMGEAKLIAHRYDQIMQAEREADQNSTRSLKEVRDGLRRQTHADGGTRD